VKGFSHYDPYYGKRLTFKLIASLFDTSPELLPGEGPIVKMYFSIPPTATEGQSATIFLDGYLDYLPFYFGSKVDYQVPSLDGLVTVGSGSCCMNRGDADHDGGVGGMDVVYFVNWLWNSGPDLPCLEEGNTNGDEDVDAMDVVYMVNWLWNFGPAPVPCP
jgi:hypothetical protein